MAKNQIEIPKTYKPDKVEGKWYKFWLEKGFFKPRIDSGKKPFVIIMPPPNVTGELHVGHALTATLEDIMVRWHRMLGEPTLWLPGVDHSGIAAQVVVEKLLAQDGIDRHQLGREKFTERMWQWASSCRGTITRQHQRLGVSCDWDRETFTLDKGPSRAVRTAFVNLYNKGLIYRGERIINWCPRCATALSDLEVNHQELTGNLYYIRYPLTEDNDKYITVATTRPETILGDTAVAVNPDDKRFEEFLGKKVILPIVKRVIPIVTDELVDPQFGTGAVKITPAHDPIDFEIAQRQGLVEVNILNPDATMNENAGPYDGFDRFEARKAILADLERDELLVKIEPYSHSVGHCQRCHTVIEPIASKQWFVKMAPLAKPAIEAVVGGRIKIIPQRFVKVYLNWMENIRDWCISRQLWWGHRIPVWYCHDCGKLTVSIEDTINCQECGTADIEQDPDVLDTWFSSALWPHSTLGWPDDSQDFGYFYPTTVMETGYDILFFWVARMIMMGIEDTGDIPFSVVYLHGLIRDERGEKMSKLRGNVLNPIDTLEKFGTDALRFAVSTGTSPGNDTKLSTNKLAAGRNFANKLWNATRFVNRSRESYHSNMQISMDSLLLEDRWIISRLNATIDNVSRLMNEYQFGEAQRQIYDFLWGEYCDWYIEIAKIRLGDKANDKSPVPVLVHVLEKALRLLHPFMPFITEELWQSIRNRIDNTSLKVDSIMIANYPKTDKNLRDFEAERIMSTIIDIIRSIRNIRAQYNVAVGKLINAEIYTNKQKQAINTYTKAIQRMAKADVKIVGKRNKQKVEEVIVLVLAEVEIAIPMASVIDLKAERRNLNQEIEKIQADVKRLEKMLSDHNFLSRAPSAIVKKERDKLSARKDNLERLEERLASLGNA
ncbi:MAG: valine--tRNA ligase [Dehalococcoidia bacterium]|nr:MAG: valine--tRNA ligase [Dehalococcoidia bacterium]